MDTMKLTVTSISTRKVEEGFRHDIQLSAGDEYEEKDSINVYMVMYRDRIPDHLVPGSEVYLLVSKEDMTPRLKVDENGHWTNS